MARPKTPEEKARREAEALRKFDERRLQVGTPEDRPAKKRGPKSKDAKMVDLLLTLIAQKIADGSLAVPGRPKRIRNRPPKANPQKRGRKPWWWSEADTPEAQETMMQWV